MRTGALVTRAARFGLAMAFLSSLAVVATAQEGKFDLNPKRGLGLGGLGKAPSEVEISASFNQEKPGKPAILAVTVKLPDGYYISSTNDKGAKTVITVNADVEGLVAVDSEFIPSRKPKTEFSKDFGRNVEKFYDSVTWFRRYQLPEGVDAKSGITLSGELSGQYCGNDLCTPLRKVPFSAELTQAVPVVRLPSELGGPGEEAPAARPAAALTAHPFTITDRPKVAGKPGAAEITFKLSPEKPVAGKTATLTITMKVDEGSHTYSMTMADKQSATPTVLVLGTLQGLSDQSSKIVASERPKEKTVNDGTTTYHQELHYGEITWTKEFLVTESGEKNGIGIAGKLQFQTCTDAACLPPQKPVFAVGMLPPDAVQKAETLKITRGSEIGSSSETPEGLIPFLITAVIAGFAALLTPCVFPMVPITVSFFLKQSESKHHRPLSMAILYCLGIMGTFTVLGLMMAALFGATSLNTLANNPWLNLGIAGVMVFFGFNLLGMFEIRVPYQLLTWTSGHEGKGGAMGVLFMALTFTLVSFTCTFAFCGLLLAWAAKGQYFWPILGMLAFSAAFASPFFFLALFPSFLKKIPKSGGWMNTVKVTMGMIELGAAAKFFSNADLAWNPTEPFLFDFTLTLTIWMVISLLTSIYLLGWFRLPSDTPTESISVPRLLTSMSFLLLAGLLGAGIFSSKEPGGELWANIKALVPARLKTGIDAHGPYIDHHGLKYTLDYVKAIEVAKAEGKPLFFDFTGVNCPNCRKMEAQMAQPENHALLENFVRVQLYTDAVPGVREGAEADRLLKINQDYQSNIFNDASLPAYLIITPEGKALSNLKGYRANKSEFTRFLEQGMKEWTTMAGGGQRPDKKTESAAADGKVPAAEKMMSTESADARR